MAHMVNNLFSGLFAFAFFLIFVFFSMIETLQKQFLYLEVIRYQLMISRGIVTIFR